VQWVFDGGRPCLDLVNTLRSRHLGGHEMLIDPAALAEWLVVAERLVNKVAAEAPVPQLRIDDDGPRRVLRSSAGPVGTALAELAVDAIDVVTAGSRVRICASDDCGLRFLDASPRHNRQWCSMSRCGNRAKARAHYARQKST
jgi:predicted RNA-binding Zn ribbon-like protein